MHTQVEVDATGMLTVARSQVDSVKEIGGVWCVVDKGGLWMMTENINPKKEALTSGGGGVRERRVAPAVAG